MNIPRQLLLDLSHRTALGRDDFLVAPSNEAAVKLVDDWPDWPAHAVLLVGPEGSGKSHLATVWQVRAKAPLIALGELTTPKAPELLSSGALALEYDEAKAFDETALFHTLNLARQQGGHVLLTSRLAPHLWKVKLPDLASRLKALPLVHISAPDDALLRGVLVKLFMDRQINVDEAVVSYMLTRMARSLAAARSLVAEIDRAAMVEKAEITRPFVARIMAAHESPELFSSDTFKEDGA